MLFRSLFPEETLVVPGLPEESYLMVVLGSYDGQIDPEIGTMPFNNPLLFIHTRDAIERWIRSLLNNDADAGALDAGPGADASPFDHHWCDLIGRQPYESGLVIHHQELLVLDVEDVVSAFVREAIGGVADLDDDMEIAHVGDST